NTSGVDSLFLKNKVKRYLGTGRLAGKGRVIVKGPEGETEIAATRILIATGSEPAIIPGLELSPPVVGTSVGAMAYGDVPACMVVIGGGVIGLELGSVWSRLGSKVTVLEYLPRLLAGMDGELAEAARKIFAAQGIEFRLGCRVTSAKAA